MEKEIIDAVKRKAIGYKTEEIVYEKALDKDGNMQIIKQKTTVKEVPPDVTAVKLLQDLGEAQSYADMTEEELEVEKQRLLNLLKESEQ